MIFTDQSCSATAIALKYTTCKYIFLDVNTNIFPFVKEYGKIVLSEGLCGWDKNGTVWGSGAMPHFDIAGVELSDYITTEFVSSLWYL